MKDFNRIDLCPSGSGFYKYNGDYGKNVCREVFWGKNSLKGISIECIEAHEKKMYKKFIEKYEKNNHLYYTVLVNYNYIGAVAYIISTAPMIRSNFEIDKVSKFSMTEVKFNKE